MDKQSPAVADVDKKKKTKKKVDVKTAQTTALQRAIKEVLEGKVLEGTNYKKKG